MLRVSLACLLAVLLRPSVALAQPYAAPEQDLWTEMKMAISNVPMALSSHQQVQQILQQVEREAQVRAARKVAPKEEKK